MIPTTVLLMTTWICSAPYSAIFPHSLSSDQSQIPDDNYFIKETINFTPATNSFLFQGLFADHSEGIWLDNVIRIKQ